MRFGDVTISVTMSALKCLQAGSLSVIIWRRNTWLFFFSKLIVVKFGLNFTAFATVIRKHFGMTG